VIMWAAVLFPEDFVVFSLAVERCLCADSARVWRRAGGTGSGAFVCVTEVAAHVLIAAPLHGAHELL
jgi:hypothetical protein